MNTLFAAGTVPLVFTIERVGRRGVLIWSAVALTVCMVIFVAMIGLPNPTVATQWIAVAAIFVYNIVFGYGWIGVCWLYGPEVGILSSDAQLRAIVNGTKDCPAQASPCWCCCRRFWRVAVLLHHRFRRWYCIAKRRLEDLDLDGFVVCCCYTIRILHVSRGKVYHVTVLDINED